MVTKRDWTEVGKEYVSPEDRERIAQQFDAATWHKLPYSLSFSAGHGLKEAIQEWKLAHPTHVADYHDIPAPISGAGLIGIRNQFKNGTINIIFADDGVSLTPVCMETVEA